MLGGIVRKIKSALKADGSKNASAKKKKQVQTRKVSSPAPVQPARVMPKCVSPVAPLDAEELLLLELYLLS